MIDENKTKEKSRILVITNGNFFSRIILSKLFVEYEKQIEGVLIITGDYKGRTGFRSLFALMRVTALPYIIYKVLSILFFRISSFINKSTPMLVKDLLLNTNINYIESESIKSPKVIKWVESIEPDLIISVSCPQLIGKKILSLSKLGGINIHSSLLPEFAGLAPYFWVLSEGCKETGITIHYLSPKFDQGNILLQRKLKIMPKDSAFILFYRLAKLGNDNLCVAVQKSINGDQGKKQNLEKYTYFSNPSIKGYRNLRKNGHVLFRFNELFDALKINHLL